MAVKFTNNAATTLAAGINSSATSISVTDGSVFPSLSSGEHFYCTFDDTTNTEIVKVTARSGNTLTVVRGQDDTTARAFSSGDKAELRVVAALLEDVKTEVTSTLNVDTFTGDDSTTAFTLSQAPSSEDNLIVFIEGVYQNPGDFTLSGTTLTLDSAPLAGRKIVAYHVSGAVSGNNLNHDQFTFSAGNAPQFTLSIAPIHENNTQVFIDGVYQQKDSYAVSGTTLTLDASPSHGATVEVMTFTQTDVNTLPASFVSGLTQVTAVGADHMMIFDATDSALKKALVSDVIEGTTGISSSADATAITIDSSERVQIGSTGITTTIDSSFHAHQSVDGDAIYYLFNDTQSTSGSTNETTQLYLGWRDAATGIGVAPRIVAGKEGDFTTAGNADSFLAFHTSANNSLGEKVRITSAGNLGIGQVSPTVLMHVTAADGVAANNYVAAFQNLEATDGQSFGVAIQAGSNATDIPLNISTHDAGTTLARLRGDADLTIGTSTATSSFYNGANSEVGHGFNGTGGYAAHVRGATNTPLYVSHSGTGNGTYIHFYQSTTGRGFIDQSGGTTRYNAASDYRLKENVVELENATSRLNSLRPVNFDWIESGENSDGFIAHEAQSIVPYAVAGNKDEVYTADNSLEEQEDLLGSPKYQAMDYGKLTPLLVKALQESNAEIEALKARIETLENA